jgi:hypothetical protein
MIRGWWHQLRQLLGSDLDQEDTSFRHQFVMWWGSLEPVPAILVLIVALMIALLAGQFSIGDGSAPPLEPGVR